MPSGEIPEPAAQRQPGDPRGGDEAERGGESVQLGLPVHIAEQTAGLSPCGAGRRIDPHTAHQRHVEEEPAVAHGEPGNVVPAALYRQREAACPCELDAGDDVRRPETADHERRPAIDHAVPDGACLVVPWIAGPQERAPQAGRQRGNLAAAWSRGRARDGGWHRHLPSVERNRLGAGHIGSEHLLGDLLAQLPTRHDVEPVMDPPVHPGQSRGLDVRREARPLIPKEVS